MKKRNAVASPAGHGEGEARRTALSKASIDLDYHRRE
jgi:hypothetical protein